MAQIAAIILAAGKGTRMKSTTPKVLHRACGLTLVEWVVRSLQEAGVEDSCLVLSDELKPFTSLLSKYPSLSVAIQQNRLGTGDAAAACSWSFKDVKVPSYAAGRHQHGPVLVSDYVLICAGDIPAVSSDEYKNFIRESIASGADVAVLGMDVPNPTGYGRLVVTGSNLDRVVEEKDADAQMKKITACNTGVLFFRTKTLFELLCELTTDNAQKEYYLTDCVSLARKRDLNCRAFVSADYGQFQGINDRVQLAEVEGLINRRLIKKHMTAGVTFRLPETSYVEADVSIGNDSEIGPGFCARGETRIGANCRIESHVSVNNVEIGSGVEVGSHSELRNTKIAAGEKLQPGSVIGLG